MKKVCLFLLSAMLTVMLAFGLVACGNNSKKPDDNRSEEHTSELQSQR